VVRESWSIFSAGIQSRLVGPEIFFEDYRIVKARRSISGDMLAPLTTSATFSPRSVLDFRSAAVLALQQARPHMLFQKQHLDRP